jgi:queuine tRNA-ribosyltransferase
MSFSFKIKHQSTNSAARVGEITTPHGRIQTPCFMPIATSGAIRCLDWATLDQIGAEICLSNTYHLHLRPGDELIKEAGGLHQFTSWPKPILTDSGGYQVFSLAKTRRLSAEGVVFQSHLDGRTINLTPEKSIAIQQNLGSDIMMALDECPSSRAELSYLKQSLNLTLDWAQRCKNVHTNQEQALFGIAQGGLNKELRLESAARLQEIGFDGYAIGGLAVGETAEEMYKVLSYTVPALPASQPRYLMGVGTPENIRTAVSLGVDMFDCVLPTRNARHGYLYTTAGVLRLANERYKNDHGPVDSKCPGACCQRYSRAYLRHLHINHEPMSMYLNTLHNLTHYLRLMAQLREEITAGEAGEKH